MGTTYRYRPDVVTALAEHGIRPSSTTPPERARELVNDLYSYELRRLRAQLRRGEIARRDYAAVVAEARDRYPLLALPLHHWVEPGER
ncbi:MAG: hypothetical protein GEV06_28160 [Luteitalea sp.]|nr:hypothetical protein [Luteitalea sp.]